MNKGNQAPAEPLGEARLFLREEMAAPERLPAGGGNTALFTTPRQPGASVNEDAAAVAPVGTDHAVLLLADGMGGAAAGDRASGITIQRTVGHLADAAPEERAIRNAVLDGIEDANREIRDMDVGAGTTILAAAVSGPHIRCYHAGDSMALIVDDLGHVRWKTMPHSPTGYAIESGLMDEAFAMRSQARHLLANAVGKAEMHVEVGAPVLLRPGETLIMASDGLFDNLHLREIGERVGGLELEHAVRELSDTALARMADPKGTSPSKPDDLTILVYRPSDPEAIGTLEFAPLD